MTAVNSLLPVTVSVTPIVSKSPPIEPGIIEALGVHPAALLFPMMQGPELGLLIEDIEAHGLHEPIVLYQGQILDGRNRLRACELAGVAPRFEEWDGVGSPVAFVMSRNLHRRHLNESQRSIVGARAKDMYAEEAAERKAATQFAEGNAGRPRDENDDEKHRQITVSANLRSPLTADAQAAKLLNVSPRSITFASRILESGDEQVIAAIEQGDITVSDAASVIALPKPKQREALDEVRHGRARTLRQAAKIQEEEEEAQTAPARQIGDELFSRKRLRIECKRFAIDLDKLLKRVDTVAMACGGPNDYTRRARECLSVALRAIQECLMNAGSARK
jgi:hypothetical protein